MLPEIIDRETFWKGKYLETLQTTYINLAKKRITWESVKRITCNGIVGIVPFTDNGETILIKQFRPPVERFVIEFPAGLNDKNEPLIEVARRELQEETGYFSEDIEEIAVGPLSAGASNEVLNVFIARNAVLQGSQNLDHAEEIEVIKVKIEGFYESLYALERDDTYIDLKLYGLFELARRHI